MNVMASRRRVQSNKQSGLSLFLIMVVVGVVIVACSFRSMSLYRQSKELEITQSQLEAQLESEKVRAEELVEKEKYMKTKKFIEDEAKNKLGLVNKDEIVIKPKEKD